jgi:RNA polymerase sigma-70 factor, ECF subfamily
MWTTCSKSCGAHYDLYWLRVSDQGYSSLVNTPPAHCIAAPKPLEVLAGSYPFLCICKKMVPYGSKWVVAMSASRRTQQDVRTTPTSAFEPFYRKHYDAISRYIARRVPPSSHDEVVASTFVVAWRKFANVSDPSLTWLYRIASYEVAHERRRIDRHPQGAELNDLQLTDSSPLEEVLDVSRAFSQLSESDAELLRLVYWENLSRSEIADVLGTSVNALNVRYHRALERLAGAVNRQFNTDRSANLSPKETQ